MSNQGLEQGDEHCFWDQFATDRQLIRGSNLSRQNERNFG